MFRFLISPRWIAFHLLIIATVVAFVGFGFWQLDRHEQRQEFNSRLLARIDQPSVPIADVQAALASGTAVEDLEWRPITASGTYLPDEQLVVVNRSQLGRPGDNVVTPLQLEDGQILLVNRGFVPLGTPPPSLPGPEVEVRGLIRVSQVRQRGQLTDPSDIRLTEVQRIDIDRISEQLPATPVPFYLELEASRPSESTPFPEPVIRPELSAGPHLSYAMQWFIFALAVVVGWVLAVRRSAQRRRLGRDPDIAVETAAEHARATKERNVDGSINGGSMATSTPGEGSTTTS
jgi:cytochrome oxidase assembly protein ShyY1